MLVCLDPGHGGYDPGAVGPTGLKEKDVTLAVTLETGFYLKGAGIDVVFTRTSDKTPWLADISKDLAVRCRIANEGRADLFVSIHCNSANSADAHGTEVYSLGSTGKGVGAAKLVQAELVKSLGLFSRGTKTANFYVLRETKMPAVLTELAFISNPREEQLLAQPGFQNSAALAIARAVANYFGVKLPDEKQSPLRLRLIINGQIADNVPFFIIEGRTYVELRSFTGVLGGEVQWDEKTKTITVLLKTG